MEVFEDEHQQGDGPFTQRASKMLSELVGGGHVLLTPSCTHALEMASMLGNFGPGDEVILPSYTFTSAATAVTKFGATPVFVDIDPITKGIDANQAAEAVNEKTVAISWVNYAGVAPDIGALQKIASEHNLLLIEDNAHGLGGIYNRKPLGSFGDFSTQSFHATKNIQCGEGGALIINNKKFIERAEIIREKGTDRMKFINGQVQKYQWVDNGSSYLMAEALAAVLLGQLESFEMIQKNRQNICRKYSEIKSSQILGLNSTEANSVAHMFYLILPNYSSSKYFQSTMKQSNISVANHYQPLHNSAFMKSNQKKAIPGRITNLISKNLIRLPLWYGISEIEVEKIVNQAERILSEVEKL
jgi:dTDP-4-amino-4,6-dideoxygalactose transaminase